MLDMHTLSRNQVASIIQLLDLFPVVVILGARQVGKSTLSQIVLPNAKKFDLERESDFLRVDSEPELLFNEVDRPIIIDEAQKSTRLFEALRVYIDANREQNGQFLLTGSSSAELLNNISETLAGRCAIVELNGFSWNEALEKKQSDFYRLLGKPVDQIRSLKTNTNQQQLLELCLYGNYPEPYLKRNNELFYQQWMSAYIQTYVERDIRTLFPTLNLDAFKRFIRMISFSTGEIINYSKFSRSLDVSQPTIKRYFEIIEGTFLWRKLPSYSKNSKKRVIKMPKGHLRDTGIVNYLLNIGDVDTLKSHPQFGQIWESFIAEQIIAGLKSCLIKFKAFHFRTSNHSEIDLIIEGDFGIIPIEIKASTTTNKKQLCALETFIEEHKCEYGILINNGFEIYSLSKKIIQIPAIFLV